jgi:uncharacterized protein YndB with AHSA1/START domain
MAIATDIGRKFAGVGEAAVRRATGRTWDEWFAILDAAGAAKYEHKGIVAVLGVHTPALGGWWRQMLSVGYEQARGLRAVHEKAGGFAANASKTIGAPLAVAFTAWSDKRLRDRWLGRARYEISKATPNKSVRIRWGDDTRVDVNLYASGPAKCKIQVQHEHLADAGAVERAKSFWRTRLDKLASLVEGERAPGNTRAATGLARAQSGRSSTKEGRKRTTRPASKSARAKTAARSGPAKRAARRPAASRGTTRPRKK